MDKKTFFGHTVFSDNNGMYLRLMENHYFSIHFIRAFAANHFYIYDIKPDENDDYFKVYFKNIDNLLNS